LDDIRVTDVTPQLDKSFSPTTVAAGQPSTLTLTITNTSENGAKSGWKFSDTFPSGLVTTGPASTNCNGGVITSPIGGSTVQVTGNLKLNDSSCTVTVPVTSTTPGGYNNGPFSTNNPYGVTSSGLTDPATATLTVVAPNPKLALSKTPNPVTYSVGSSVAYSFTVTNTGNEALSALAVNDSQFSGSGPLPPITCANTTLDIGASTSCSTVYTATTQDVAASVITNEATASAQPPVPFGGTPPAPVVSSPADATVRAATPTGLTLVKGVSPTNVSAANSAVTYSFSLTNTGTQALANVVVNDSTFSGSPALVISCPFTSLAAGASGTCTAPYTVSQHDVDAGTVVNTADATGTSPNNRTVQSNNSTAAVTINNTASMTLVKSVSPNTVGASGGQVSYSFVVSNTGNVQLTNIAPVETFSGATPLIINCLAGTTLAVRASETCTASYLVTPADVATGRVTNTAHFTATSPSGASVSSNASTANVTRPVPASSGISLVKSASPASVSSVGTVITYSFLVSNSTATPVGGILVADSAFSGQGAMSSITCPTQTIAAGSNVKCASTYTVTQADLDAGVINNTAAATGVTTSNKKITSNSSTALVTALTQAKLALVKTVSPSIITGPGNQVRYTFFVKNNGTVTQKNVRVADFAFTGSGSIEPITCGAQNNGAVTLTPGSRGLLHGLVTVSSHAASAAGVFMMASNSTGVKRPSRACRRLRW